MEEPSHGCVITRLDEEVLVFQDSIATVGLAEGEGGNQAAMAAFLKEEKLHLPVVSLLE